ncbi:MAG TPA: hypothetical protein VGS21_03305, partial [Acidimicrobiales bacterium]|nr:hypothetical protein [Acidimicrobiales bacterium]
WIAYGKGVSAFVPARNVVSPARLGHTLLLITSGEVGGVGTPWELGAVILAVATCGAWILAIVAAAKDRGLRETVVRRHLAVATLLGWIVVPVLGQVAVSVAIHPMFQYRYFVLALPAAAILSAIGLERFRGYGRWPYAASLVAVLVVHALFVALFYT